MPQFRLNSIYTRAQLPQIRHMNEGSTHMAETSLYLLLILCTVYAGLRLMRYVRAQRKKRQDERLKQHLNWQQHPRKPAV